MPPKRPNTYASQGPSQRRRNQASPSSDDDSEDGEYDGHVAGGQATQNGGGGGGGGGGVTQGSSGGLKDTEIKAKAGQLARYALFQEYKKNIIRRADIVKNVIPNNSRAYNFIFAEAQKILKETVGCEMVEIRSRNKGAAPVDGTGTTQAAVSAGGRKGKGRARQNGDDDEDDEDEETPTATQRTKNTNTKAYILRSTLSPQLLAAMSNPSPLPLGAESDENAGEDSGALIQWEKGDGTSSGHIALFGLRTVILAIVMTMGRVISDDALHAYLRRLNLKRETILPYTSSDSKEPPLTLDRYLDLLARQNYLEKIKLPGHASTEGGETYDWKWGQREVEFSEKDAVHFIEQVILGDEDDSSSEEDEEGDRRRRRGNRVKVDKVARRKKLHDDIIKAAGGEILGL
ncbi:uncharacterized protein IL334_006221 [Kwoniella shivajii]|uniref:MAGE domain-containing protein n=1 Tax=Kwoniella shivajii TaxID=564305 RepID=A0ABZ1D9A7_9TREE|nr:hypothetical protein IL334_006221 [Kwoniella shivajii]